MIDFVSINNAVELTKKLRNLTKRAEYAEFREIVLDLVDQIQDVRGELQELRSENEDLKKEKSKIFNKDYSAFKYEGSEQWFCNFCFDERGKKMTLHMYDGKLDCPNCASPNFGPLLEGEGEYTYDL